MDNLCHSLAGAVLGEAGLKRRTALGMATLVIASNLPDIDVAVFATDTLAMSVRRGWTHGVVAQAVLPALLAVMMYGWDRLWRRAGRRDANLAGLLLLSYIGLWLHVFMDWLNSYGVRLLKPFSDQWFYGDALYIVDPILYAVFGIALVLARRAHGRGEARSTLWPRRALVVAGIYIVAMLASNWWARAEVRRGLVRAGRGDERFMVTPVFGNPFRRDVIVDTGDRYEKGFLWFTPTPRFRPAGYGVDVNATKPAAQIAAESRRFQDFLMWSRFPFFVIEQSGGHTVVVINDYRYSGPSGRDGWATQTIQLPARQ
jgi:inner membrane protein